MSSRPAKRRAQLPMSSRRASARNAALSASSPVSFVGRLRISSEALRRLSQAVVRAQIETFAEVGDLLVPVIPGQICTRDLQLLRRRDAMRPSLHRGMPDRLQRVLQQRQLVRPMLELFGQPLGGAQEQVRHPWREKARPFSVVLAFASVVLALEPVAQAPVRKDVARRLNDREPQVRRCPRGRPDPEARADSRCR